MRKPFFWANFAILPLILLFTACQDLPLHQRVDPFIGTGGHGHTYPGASAPFGMVQLSPDTRTQGWDGCSGYHYSDRFLYGFSHTHLSGTGVGDYADILILPLAGPTQNDSTGQPGSRFSHEKENAFAGYYKTFLDDYGIEANMTATKRAGMMKLRFDNAANSRVLVDLKYRDKVTDSRLTFLSDTLITGYRFSSGWAAHQKLFFAMAFDRPVSRALLWKKDSIVSIGSTLKGNSIQLVLHFNLKDGDVLKIKTGLSAVDEKGALQNLQTEIPGWSFVDTKDKVTREWDKELSKIKITTPEVNKEEIFYTALYHSMLNPNIYSDVDGRYRGRDDKIHRDSTPYYTVFSLWDTYRAEHPLLTIIDRKRTSDFINTMLRQYRQGGLLPVWELSANETNCMIGNHAIPVIADAMVNGVKGFDYNLAYEAMKASMEQNSPDLISYRNQGFIPSDMFKASVSKTLEYAYDDWCIARVARLLGNKDDEKKYLLRAQSYKNVFDTRIKKMRPRYNGGWKTPFDPREVDFNFTEANSWQYSFYVPQDVQGLISLNGGDSAFCRNLDSLFTAPSETKGRHQSDITGLIGQYAHGNEPSHHTAYLYAYAGQAWKTQQLVSKIRNELYTDKPDGLCGNEDCGQMSAWYVFSALGFYPVQPASGIYVFGSPEFEKAELRLENGKSLIINKKGEGVYIDKVKLNGREYPYSFISYKDIQKGGRLDFYMSRTPNKNFGHDPKYRPPSHITPTLVRCPVIRAGSQVFYDSLQIEIISPDSGQIYYSNGSGSFYPYKGRFTIRRSSIIEAYAIHDSLQSPPVSGWFYKGKPGQKITVVSKYNNQYTGGGPNALVDFRRGSTNYADGKWQGFEGRDLEVVISLKQPTVIHQISTGFLQDIDSWIFMPLWVEYSVSKDSIHWQELPRIYPKNKPHKQGAVIENFTRNDLNIKDIRFIKIKAESMIKCPEWHQGFLYDGKAWIFADEIVIE